MPTTVEIQVFKFDELSEKAKEKALNDFCAEDIYPHYPESDVSLQAFCELLHVNVLDYSYGDPCGRNYIKTDACNETFRGLKYNQFNFSQMPTGYYLDCVLLEQFKKAWKDSSSALIAFRSALDAFIQAINEDVENWFSMENLKNMSESNNWTYLQDGKFFAAS